MRAIFISYRRDDSEGQAGRLLKDLASHFGQDAVFMDVAAIAAGRDFRRVIDENVGTCGVLLALIGKGWVTAQDASGQRRLDDPADFVRLETASALKRDIPVVPVLVHGAVMPRADQLPPDLAELAYRNGVELTHARWDSDVQVLIKALEPYVQVRSGGAAATAPPAATPKPSRGPVIAMAVGALAATAAAFGGYLWFAAPKPDATPTPIAIVLPEFAAKPASGSLEPRSTATPAANASATAAEAERMARDKGEQDALAARIAADKRKAETLAANNAAAEKAARDKAAADKALADKAAADKLASDKALADKVAADKLVSDRALADKAADKLAADRALADKAAADKLESDRAAAAAATTLPQEQRTARQLSQRPTRWTPITFPPPNGGAVLIAILSDGNPACASYNAASCLWGVSLEQLDTTRLRPLVCGELHRARWGVTGYEDPKHWCSLARAMNGAARPQR